MTTAVVPPAMRQVQVWLGEHAFIDHVEPDPSAAALYAAAMRQRFASCRVTNTPYFPTPEQAAAAGQPGT